MGKILNLLEKFQNKEILTEDELSFIFNCD